MSILPQRRREAIAGIAAAVAAEKGTALLGVPR
jgi:hypothetical protein